MLWDKTKVLRGQTHCSTILPHLSHRDLTRFNSYSAVYPLQEKSLLWIQMPLSNWQLTYLETKKTVHQRSAVLRLLLIHISYVFKKWLFLELESFFEDFFCLLRFWTSFPHDSLYIVATTMKYFSLSGDYRYISTWLLSQLVTLASQLFAAQ